jgi:predicted aldo/keto reductase-like oxidoreductase
MLYRTYGNTGKSCSILGFGGMRFSNVDDRDACVAALVRAAQGGVNYFDTAPAYFGVRSETVFGEAFREMRRLRLPYYCSTKTTAASETAIRTEVEAQLDRLGVESIDFYHVWCVLTLPAWEERKRQGVVTAFRRLKDEGLVKHICVSSHLVGDEIRQLLDEDLFEGALFGYSAYNFAAREKAFEAIRSRGLGCVVMNPLGGGLIPQNPEVFEFLRSYPGQGVVEAALHFLWSHPGITVTLVGFADVREVDEALAAVARFRAVDEAHVRRVKETIGGSFVDLCTGCQYCEPCPEGVPVSKMMDAFNHFRLAGGAGGGGGKAALDRLKWHWNVRAALARQCSECGQCEQACTQHLPIIQRLQQIAGLA